MTTDAAYRDWLSAKLTTMPATGIPGATVDHAALSPFQRDLTTWTLRRGRAALFADTGLGKTRMQIVYAHEAQRHLGGCALILSATTPSPLGGV